jgi:hypothetical protein
VSDQLRHNVREVLAEPEFIVMFAVRMNVWNDEYKKYYEPVSESVKHHRRVSLQDAAS